MNAIEFDARLLDNPSMMGVGSDNYINAIGVTRELFSPTRSVMSNANGMECDLLNFDKLGEEMSNLVSDTTLKTEATVARVTSPTPITQTTSTLQAAPLQAAPLQITPNPFVMMSPLKPTSIVATQPIIKGTVSETTVQPIVPRTVSPSVLETIKNTAAQAAVQAVAPVTPVIALPTASIPMMGGGGGGGGGEKQASPDSPQGTVAVQKKIFGMKPVVAYSVGGVVLVAAGILAYMKFKK